MKIGKISYLNCLPFYFGLEERLKNRGLKDIEFLEDYPANINSALREGRIALGPVSSLEYLRHQNEYLLLPDICIGAQAFARSVLLLSRKKIEELNGGTIALSKESYSSISLIKIILKHSFGFKNSFETVAQNLGEIFKKHIAAVVIGDEALFCQPKTLIYKYDLARLWRNLTNLPFVFSLWVARKDFAKNNPDELHEFCHALRENTKCNLADLEKMIFDSMKIDLGDARFCQLIGYFDGLEYSLDNEMQQGLTRFFNLAYEDGLVRNELSEIEFFN